MLMCIIADTILHDDCGRSAGFHAVECAKMAVQTWRERPGELFIAQAEPTSVCYAADKLMSMTIIAQAGNTVDADKTSGCT